MISVIVPAYNAANTITACVNALQHQDVNEPYEIIVVDDGSSDATAVLAKEAGATVIYKDRSRPAAARNAGVQAARGDLVCFTDADCAPKGNWLRELCRPFSDDEVIGCKGIYATQQKELVARFVQIEYEDKYDLLYEQEQIDFIDTYSAAYLRSILIANDGFDEQFPYLEDQELSFRLAARGYKMVFQPTAVVEHLHSNTLLRYIRKKLIIGYWKAQVVRRFPTQGVKDSHTPQVMKLQMLLMAAMMGAALILPFTSWASLPLIFLLIAFLLTTGSFVGKAWQKDRAVALAAPFLLATRAASLGVGYAWGVIRPQRETVVGENIISGGSYVGKRLIDILGSIVGIIFTLICFPFIALAIKLNSPGKVIFKQQRIGQRGKPFTLYKFRSMHENAEEELQQLVDINALDEPVFKIKNDPRLTAVGVRLRRWSLDELPQFWNVLKGDMSLIGPRPEEARVVEHYNDWHRRRLAIKPGMTGPMQINGRGDLPLDTRVQLELEYIENYSLWRDMTILFKTIPAVIKGTGAH